MTMKNKMLDWRFCINHLHIPRMLQTLGILQAIMTLTGASCHGQDYVQVRKALESWCFQTVLMLADHHNGCIRILMLMIVDAHIPWSFKLESIFVEFRIIWMTKIQTWTRRQIQLLASKLIDSGDNKEYYRMWTVDFVSIIFTNALRTLQTLGELQAILTLTCAPCLSQDSVQVWSALGPWQLQTAFMLADHHDRWIGFFLLMIADAFIPWSFQVEPIFVEFRIIRMIGIRTWTRRRDGDLRNL